MRRGGLLGSGFHPPGVAGRAAGGDRVAILVGGQIGGVISALIALPVAAVYPYVERIWLRSQVGDATVQRHRAIEQRPAS
jgi:hypothetical protein